MNLMIIAGARPNFMKIAPIFDAIKKYNMNAGGERLDFTLVHTGQHYDDRMSDFFFNELKIPRPDFNLGVGSGSHASQTAEIMKKFEPVLLERMPDILVVVGDVNSTVACSIVASKISYTGQARRRRPLIAHVESGLRSFDRSMPEEINRVLTDAISDILFTTEESANENLKREGISQDKVYFVGNVMIDTLLRFREKVRSSEIFGSMGVSREGRIAEYALLTLHRPSNVDNADVFNGIMKAVIEVSARMPVIFPVHPRTRKAVEELASGRLKFEIGGHVESGSVYCVPPLGYLDFLGLMSNARLVLTDSGGIQEETTVLGVPCVTLRENTERPVTISEGTNILAGTGTDDIVRIAGAQIERPAAAASVPPLWDGKAAERIIGVLAEAGQKVAI